MGAERSLEKPSGSSSWVVISFIRSMSIVSSSSPFDKDENFLKGLRPSVASCEDAMGVEVVVEKTVVDEDMMATDFTGEITGRGLGGDKSRLSFRGAQLTGTLKLNDSTVRQYMDHSIFNRK